MYWKSGMKYMYRNCRCAVRVDIGVPRAVIYNFPCGYRLITVRS